MTVSDHAGRQLATALPANRALPPMVEAIAGRVPVLVAGFLSPLHPLPDPS